MANRHFRTVEYQMPLDAVFSLYMEALPAAGFRAVPNYEHRSIVAHVGVSFWSWGENINIAMTVTPSGSTAVTIYSASSYALVDWGKNRKNVEKILAAVNARLR